MKWNFLTLAGLAWLAILNSALAEGTAFTYQGRLNEGGATANGIYDLRFTIYDAPAAGNVSGGPVTNATTVVSNGLFTVVLDFGSSPFAAGAPEWLEIAVLPTGSTNSFTVLNPRHPLTPTPYAITARTVAGGINGNTISNGTITASKIATNQVVTSLNKLRDDVTLTAGLNIAINVNTNNGTNAIVISAGAGGGGNAWLLTGNTNTIPGVNFLGTIDNKALQLHVNSTRALRLEPGFGVPAPNVIGGAPNNLVGATFGGGAIGGGDNNVITANYSAIAGGTHNATKADYSTIGGGFGGFIDVSPYSTIGGGSSNVIHANASGATIGGGSYNVAADTATTISGGEANAAKRQHDTVGGGTNNIASGAASTDDIGAATVSGGQNNNALGPYAAVGGGAGNTAMWVSDTVAGATLILPSGRISSWA